ncbi:MAG: hypothetical protein JSV36_07415, partial [Anaerolineae bacterium]
LALAQSLGTGHHPSLVVLAVFFLVYLIMVDPRLLVQPRRWWRPLLLALVALLPLIYLPLRGAADAPLAPSDLDTLDGFIHHVTAQGFEGDMFAFANAQDLPQRLILLPTLFLFQFNPLLLTAAALGLLLLAWRDRRLLGLMAGGLTLHTYVTITYRAPQTVEYLMPAYLPIAVLVGLAMAWLLSPLLSRFAAGANTSSRVSLATTLLAAVILWASLNNGLQHAPSFFTLAQDRSTRVAMELILNQAPPDALILADWHWATPLWYLQRVEGQRPDVEVRYVFPVPGQQYRDTWRDRIETVIGQRPLLLTHAYEWPDYTLEPLGRGFAIHERPYTVPSGTYGQDLDLAPQDTVFHGKDGGVRLLGYRLSHWQPKPGQAIELTLAWQAVGELEAAPSFSAKLLKGDGSQLSQGDRYLGTGYSPGEIRVERLVLPLYPSITPGDYPLALEVYSTSEAGFESWLLEKDAPRLNLMMLSIHPNQSPPVTLYPMDVPFADGPTLIGVDYDRSVPGTLRLYLHWRGPAQGAEQVRVGDVIVRLPALPDGAYQSVVLDLPGETGGPPRLTLTGENGQTKSSAGPWGWPVREVRLPTPASAARFVPFGDEMALIGVSPGPEKILAPDDQLLVRLTFLALKPLVSDNGVSVRLLDEAGQWRQMHDLQPALGALPTLKWIRGARIVDPHPLSVPPDITGGAVRATLVVYENFLGTPLPPLDGRMTQVPLGEWAVRTR